MLGDACLQPRDDRGDRIGRCAERLQRDSQLAGVGGRVDRAGDRPPKPRSSTPAIMAERLRPLILHRDHARESRSLCAASVTATIEPVSCCGRKPFGTMT